MTSPAVHRIHRAAAALALAGLTWLGGCAVAPPAASPTAATAAPAAPATLDPVMPPPALKVLGVPPLSRALLEQSSRYSKVAGHGFVDWHPLQREMLVVHRAPAAATTQLYRLRTPLGTPEPLTDGADPVAGASWEPRSGRYIVFTRGSGGNEAYQLFRLDPLTRETVQITAPDQRHVLLAWVKSRSLALVSSLPLDRTAEAGKRTTVTTTLRLVDPMNPGAARTLAELPGGGWMGAEVSPDERQLAITRYVSATESEVWLLDLASGQRRRVLPAPGEPLWASHFVGGWSADGKTLFITSDRLGEFREAMRLDLARGTLQRLTAAMPWDVSWASRSADGRTVALTVNADGRDEMRLVDTGSGAVRPLPALPDGSLRRGDFHPTRNELAFVASSAQGPGQIHSLDLGSGVVSIWTLPTGTEGLNLQALPEPQIVRFKGFDGLQLSGVLSLPPARFAGARPVLLMMHGGPAAQAKLGFGGRTNHLIEHLGVAVLQPNVRGSSGYGKTFVDLDNGRLRENSVKDMASAIDWIATQPRLDASRVLVIGGSYGGYMALAASTRLADRIAGAVSTVGISNFVSFLENTESYRRDLRRVEYGDERDPSMRAFLQDISPLSHVDKITKPLMVVQGRNDPRVPWTESEQIVRSLQTRGTPVWYLLADNEGHGFARRDNADYQFAALVRFIELTLRP